MKSSICLNPEVNVTTILEDNPKEAIDCALKKIRVILFDRPWNKDIYHFYLNNDFIRIEHWKEVLDYNITRVESWKEALEKI